jgi:2'-5' RNA ligase/GNAT superfamily N-acetyltransferase
MLRRRLTVALVVTGPVAQEIDGIRRALGARALTRIPPHLTLVPPVNVAEDAVTAAVDDVRQAAEGTGPIRLGLGPPGTFWPAAPVVYLRVLDLPGAPGALDEIAALRRRLLAGPLARPDDRAFVPHVTLDQSIDPARIPHVLAALADYRQELTLGQVTTLDFDPSTKRWRALATAALGRPRVAGTGGLEIRLSISATLEPESERFRAREWAEYADEAYGDSSVDEPFAVTARIAGELAGTATGQLRSDYARLANLITAAHWRNHGVGSQLLRTVEQLAIEHGAPAVRLETRAGGPAEQWYLERGYRPIATLPRFRRGHDFLLMERMVGPPPGRPR